MIHFVHENAERPVIDGLAVALVEQDLGCDVFRRATEGVGAVDHHLREAEVGEL